MTAHQPQAEARRKLLAAARLAKPAFARNGRALPRAFFLTDPDRTPDPVAIAARLPHGFGVIYRHFGVADRRQTALALAKICRRRGLMLLIAADAALARETGAAGVHWPGRMLGRRVTGVSGRMIETASAHSQREIARARRAGMDAVIVSAVFPSASASAGAPMGPARFRLCVLRAGLPVYALGGVSAFNAARAIGSGRTTASGWAAISSVATAWG